MALDLPELVIEPYPGVESPITFDDLSVRLDGQELRGLRSLDIRLATGEVNEADIEIVVGRLRIDARVAALLGVDAIDAEAKEDKHG